MVDASRRRVHRTVSEDRLTVSLAPGQRDDLEVIAAKNGVKLAFVVRSALTEFIHNHSDKQLRLTFPELTSSVSGAIRPKVAMGEGSERGSSEIAE